MSLLYAAAAAEIGLLLFSPEPERLRQTLYRTRQKALDSTLANLEFRLLSETELAICHPIESLENVP